MTRFQMFRIQSIGVLAFPLPDAKTGRLKASYALYTTTGISSICYYSFFEKYASILGH